MPLVAAVSARLSLFRHQDRRTSARKAVPICTLLAAAAVCTWWPLAAHADKQTVCTITVNSADEKEAFRRSLPQDKYQFVELVERGRPDWLASACRQGVRCDVLVISGHYDGGNEFFSDRLETREYLPVDEMERVACSDSCPGLFTQLKEVYLFGCNTMDAQAQKNASAEIGRSFLRSGHSPAEAARLARTLSTRHGESSRDRMQQIFMNVPAIYGFSSVAPLGPTAASILDRHFRSGGAADVGRGLHSTRLLRHFSAHAMTVTGGLRNSDPRAAHRRDVCQFADDRLTPAQKLKFVHGLLGREMAEVRMFLDRIERYSASLTDAQRHTTEVSAALDAIARDQVAQDRYLEFARDADAPAVRARMVQLARGLGWLSASQERTELMRMIGGMLSSRTTSPADVDLVCTLNQEHVLDDELPRLQLPELADNVTHAAILACLGSAVDRDRVLRALVSRSDDDVRIAQVFLRHRPIDDVGELRSVTADIARMDGSDAQVRALQALAHHRLTDRESLDQLTQLYPFAGSASVQTAIASVLIRADYRSIARPELVQTLRQHRLKSDGGEGMIDVLIRRLQAL